MGIFKKALCSALASLTLLSTAPVAISADTTVDFTENNILSATRQTSVNEAALESNREAQLEADLKVIASLPKDIFNLNYAPANVSASIKRLHSLFGTDLYVWLADLYDADLAPDNSKFATYAGYSGEGDTDYIKIGGFYYSTSAKNGTNTLYLPDLESTAQILSFLDSSGFEGASDKVLGEIFPEEAKEQMYHFAMSMKSADGYYYHPQWGTSITSSRKGRDQGWGNDIINAFGSSVTAASCDITDPLSTSVEFAVSKVTAASKVVAAANTKYDYSYNTTPSANPKVSFDASSWTSLKKYVDYMLFNVKNSYDMGNNISSNVSQIQNNGLRAPLVEYLTILQNEYFKNGFFETEVSYNACNGVMKICGIFGGNYGKYPNVDLALSGVINIMKGEIDSNGNLTQAAKNATDSIAFTYNQWYILYKLVGQTSESQKALIANILKNNAHTLIDVAYQKLLLFKKSDGGFSYNQEYSSATSQGSLVAVPLQAESDVNATVLAASPIRYIYRVYQLYNDYENAFDIPLLYTVQDGVYFKSLINAKVNPDMPPVCSNHSFTNQVFEPTCTAKGYTLHSCDCGYSYIDSKVDAYGHSCKTKVVRATCLEQGYYLNYCDCGYSYKTNYTEPTGHNFKYTVTEPTCESGGKTVGQCVDCNMITIGEETEALGHDYVDGVCQNCNDGASDSAGDVEQGTQQSPEKPKTVRRRLTFGEAIARFFSAIGRFLAKLFGIKLT